MTTPTTTMTTETAILIDDLTAQLIHRGWTEIPVGFKPAPAGIPPKSRCFRVANSPKNVRHLFLMELPCPEGVAREQWDRFFVVIEDPEGNPFYLANLMWDGQEGRSAAVITDDWNDLDDLLGAATRMAALD